MPLTYPEGGQCQIFCSTWGLWDQKRPFGGKESVLTPTTIMSLDKEVEGNIGKEFEAEVSALGPWSRSFHSRFFLLCWWEKKKKKRFLARPLFVWSLYILACLRGFSGYSSFLSQSHWFIWNIYTVPKWVSLGVCGRGPTMEGCSVRVGSSLAPWASGRGSHHPWRWTGISRV